MVHIFNRFSQGDKVDLIVRGSDDIRGALRQISNQGIANGKLSLGIGAQNAFQKAKEEAQGTRRRAVIDHVVDENEIRIMFVDTGEMAWVSPMDLEPLDAVSVLADAVTSKSLKEQLNALETEERAQSEVREKAHGFKDEIDEAGAK